MPQRRATAFLFLMITAIFLLVTALILLMTRTARADEVQLPAGITCELIREKIAEHGKFIAIAWAIRQGYSAAQIRVARRCLK